MPVTGIGGFFFRARDPKALAAWYSEHLGVVEMWQQQAGMTVFTPFTETNDYYATEKRWMLNLRVSEIDALLATLREAGIAVETRAEWDNAGIGRFARIHDPEGNPIELWEPPANAPG